MPVFKAPSNTELPTSPFSRSHSSFFPSPTTPVATPSPLIDAIDMKPQLERRDSLATIDGADLGVVKIGQTSLHNPGGRSSWIGL